MAETKAPAKKPSGIMRVLETPGPLGLPWIVWGAVAVGVGVVTYIWFRSQNKPTADAGTTSSNPGDANALGLAIDPTTGLPYAVEGLVPSGGLAGGGGIDAQELNMLQQEIDQLIKDEQPPPPSQQVGPQNIHKPPIRGHSIHYPGGMTIPAGGLEYTLPRNRELHYLAEDAYGEVRGGDWTYIVKANPSLKGDTAETQIKKGRKVLLPQVPLQDSISTS